MGINKGKGGKGHKKRKNKNIEDNIRELIFKEDSQIYGQITKNLGGGRFNVLCFEDGQDNKDRLCSIRGKMRKKEWVGVGDVVLVSLREFQDDRGDIILKYYPDEVRSLKAYNELDDSVNSKENNDDDAVEFGYESDDVEMSFDEIDNL